MPASIFDYRGVTFIVTLNAAPGRRTRWTFLLPSGATGSGHASNRGAALHDGEGAARIAVAKELDGHD